MNKPNFQQYLFHASGIKNLMVKPRKKDETLSETTKSYLQEIWIEAMYKRKKFVISKEMKKGTMIETDTIDLVQKVTSQTFFKNNQSFSNEFVTGTPDIIDAQNRVVIDIKSSWDLWTFAKVDEDYARDTYYYQVLTYMWLLGFDRSSLMFGLVNTPEMLITDELYKLSFQLPEDEVEKYRQNYIFDDIEPEKRMKRYDFTKADEDIEAVKEKIVHARAYLEGLSL